MRRPPPCRSGALAPHGPGRRLGGEAIEGHRHLVEARRRHGEAQQPVDPDYAAPARGKRGGMEQAARANAIRLGALVDLTRRGRRRPGSAPADSRLVAAELPANGVSSRWHSCRMRAIIPPPPPVRHAQPVHCPLPSAIEQAAANDEAPPAGRSVAGATG